MSLYQKAPLLALMMKYILFLKLKYINKLYRGVLITPSQLQPSKAHGLLPYPGVCAMHPHCGAILGFVLDTPRGNQ